MISARMLVATALAVCGFQASAQAPVITSQWEAASVNIGFHDSVSACIFSSIGASNTWNRVGVDLHLQTDSLASHPRVDEQTQAYNYSHITVEDDAQLLPGALMEARIMTNSQTGTILNADIFVDRRHMNQTQGLFQFSCDTGSSVPPDKYDWESAILHEFGHIVGFQHTYDQTGCSMYKTLKEGESRRVLCEAEKQEYIRAYGLTFRIMALENVAGPQGANIPARVFYKGTPVFPVRRETKIVECASGWECSDYIGTYTAQTPSPLTFYFRCTNTTPLPTATFRWRTTLIDANGMKTNSVDHTSTCTTPPGAIQTDSADPVGGNRIIITQ
ncbi:hypothetical protein [Lysobacter firmicutimachus]|uniref:Peptidase metallopeptidase domain-containing protein n=1 Tax=Lysobacter firmicutimachus TaxID=1792846 RepID=A0ABU8D0V3_9GAMM